MTEPPDFERLFRSTARAAAHLEMRDDYGGSSPAFAAWRERRPYDRILRRGDRRFAVVLEEWALRSQIGSTEMMTEQLAHLAQQSALPAVALGIIPASAARTMWSSPGFGIFDESRVLIETPAAELAITQPREISIYLRTLAELAAMAVYGSHARELINRAAADMR